MVTLKQARETGKLDQFIAERGAEKAGFTGGVKALPRVLASTSANSKTARARIEAASLHRMKRCSQLTVEEGLDDMHSHLLLTPRLL